MRDRSVVTFVALFKDRLQAENYSKPGMSKSLRVIRELGAWLERTGGDPSKLNEQIVRLFCRANRNRLRSCLSATRKFLQILREARLVPIEKPKLKDQWDAAERDFCDYLARERGLNNKTITLHKRYLSRFSQAQRKRHVEPRSLTAENVVIFADRCKQRLSQHNVLKMCWTLKAFLRFLHYKGYCARNLVFCVPSVRKPPQTLFSYLSLAQVEMVLKTCNRKTAAGKRNYAILLLLARLGLRADEVTTLTLANIDWELGQIKIYAKGGKEAYMPLPKDVGAAVADYLRFARPECESRRVFVRHKAPIRGFASHTNVSAIASRAEAQARIPFVKGRGARLFRRSLATQMLKKGSPMREIAQVLRHSSEDTTRIYAIVDIQSLRRIALPWPRDRQ